MDYPTQPATVQPAGKVKCEECGFLCIREGGHLMEADAEYRKIVTGGGLESRAAPLCFARAFPLAQEYEEALRVKKYPVWALGEVLRKERPCLSFTPWHQGFTPKEHREMLFDLGKRLVEPVLVWVVTFRTWSSFTLSWRFCSCHKATHPIPAKHNTGDNSLNSGGAAACPCAPSAGATAWPNPPSTPGDDSLTNSRPPALPPTSPSPSYPPTSATTHRPRHRRLELVLGNGRLLHIPQSFDPAALRRLLIALEDHSC